MKKIIVLGLNHKFAPVEVREKLAFSKKEIPSVLLRLKEVESAAESLILSTCNRVEIYAAVEDPEMARRELFRFLSGYRDFDEACFARSTYFYEGAECVRHLFRVACGLDSMVVGEYEILGQIKEAFKAASEAGNVKSLLHQLFERAFRTSKKTKQETKISEGAVSVSSVAVELAQKIFGRLTQENILILGTGKMSELTMKRLLKVGSKTIWVASRNADRSEELARKYGVQPVHFDEWKERLRETDIVISSTAAPHPIVRYDDVRQVMAVRKHKPLFLIDIAVPRDVEERVNTLEDVYLYNIDDLQNVCQSNMSFRRKEISKCESIIENQVDEFVRWSRSLDSAPTIRQLQAYLDRLVDDEIAAIRVEDPEKKREIIRMLDRIKSRILHGMITKLKEGQAEGGGYHYHETLQTLFDLESVKLHESQENPDREPGERIGPSADRDRPR